MPRVSSSKERAVRAVALEEPDYVPFDVWGTTPRLMTRIIGETPYYRNPPVYLGALADGEHDTVYGRVAQDQVKLCRGLGADLVRVDQYYDKETRVRSLSENIWSINGVRHQFLPDTNMLWPLDPSFPVEPDAASHHFLERSSEARTVKPGSTETIERVVRMAAGEMLVFANADGSFPTGGREMVQLLRWMYTRPDLVQRCLDYTSNHAIAMVGAYLDAGVDGIYMCDDYAYKKGPFMAPQHFREFVEPRLRRQVDAIHRRGAIAAKHTDGNVNLLLDDILGTGVDVLQSLDPQARMDLGEVKERYGHRVCLSGNMDIAYTLALEPPSTVEREVKACVEAAGPGGGYILSPSNCLHPSVRFGNLMAMVESVRRFGEYPLRAVCSTPRARLHRADGAWADPWTGRPNYPR